MEFQLSDEQSLLVSTLRRFIDSELRPLEDAVELTGELAVEDAERILKTPAILASMP